MLITRKSPLTGKETTLDLDVTPEQLERTKTELIQRVLPHLSPAEREFIMTGYTAEDWNKIFPLEDADPVTQGDQSVLVLSDRFTYKDGVFAAEASDLEWREIPHEFRIVSTKTGNSVGWRLTHTERDREGDVRWWSFEPLPADKALCPSLKNVIVFND